MDVSYKLTSKLPTARPDASAHIGPHEIALTSGYGRDAQRYIEGKGILGPVARNGSNERAFTAEQAQLFEHLRALQDIGLSLDQATALATEAVGTGVPQIDDERLLVLLDRSRQQIQQHSKVLVLLSQLVQQRAARTSSSAAGRGRLMLVPPLQLPTAPRNAAAQGSAGSSSVIGPSGTRGAAGPQAHSEMDAG